MHVPVCIQGESGFWTAIMTAGSSSGTKDGLLIYAGSDINDTALHIRNQSDDTSYMVVRGDGNVGIGTTSPSYNLHVVGDIAYTGNIYNVSDLRLKDNLNPIENAVKKVSSINGIYFNYKGESAENRKVGVIAQEVEEVLPEVVSEGADGYKSVDYSKLTPLLIEAIKAQQAQIEGLKAQNERLQTRIEALEKR